MVDREVFDRRLARLEELIARLRNLGKTPRDAFLADDGLKAQAERWLHLAAESMLDMTLHMIADQGWPTPTTNRAAMMTLAEQGVLPRDLASELETWAGLRNVLVHLYLDVDHEVLFEIITGELDCLERFAKLMAAWTE